MTSSHRPETFDVIIVGGSYSGLAAGMALGRALRSVLIIDGGRPCNAQTPHSHNFLTQDGKAPGEIAALGKQQVEAYDTVQFRDDIVTSGEVADGGFLIKMQSGAEVSARKLIFASGIRDLLPAIDSLAECWGISALHCPYCHGYEVHGRPTTILGNGDAGFEFAGLISNWTSDLTLLTNGESTLTEEQLTRLEARGIGVNTNRIARVEHEGGRLRRLIFGDGASLPVDALYVRPKFEQHCPLPAALGCAITDDGYIEVDRAQKTTVPEIFACGDNTSNMRTVANAVATGTAAGMMVNKELALEAF